MIKSNRTKKQNLRLIKQMEDINKDISYKLALLELQPVDVILSDGTRLFMENVVGTTKFLGHLRKKLYDVTFESLYYHNKKIPKNHFALNNMILKIEAEAESSDPEKFLAILDKKVKTIRGSKIYLDDVLFKDSIPFMKTEKIRNKLLLSRNDGKIQFKVLKVIDPSGNTTEFIQR